MFAGPFLQSANREFDQNLCDLLFIGDIVSHQAVSFLTFARKHF